jgi:ubiquinone/menaquinone biosynthesis C-methylase UbiE
MGNYIPPLRFHLATRFYDPIVRLTTREKAVKRALQARLAARPHESILDLGCGTGTLALSIARECAEAQVWGLDADSAALTIARAKQAREGLRVHWRRGLAQAAPFPDDAFDAVASSLFFHHLHGEDKLAVLREVVRILRPGGRLVVADWGRPASMTSRMLFLAVQTLDGFETTQDCVNGILPSLMIEAGLESVATEQDFKTPLGTISLYAARRPPHQAGGQPAVWPTSPAPPP